jgi:hypothetical protein
MRQQPPKEPQGPGKALQPHHRKGDQPRRLAFHSTGMLPGVCGVSLSLGMAMVGLFVGCLVVRRLPAAWNGRM